MPDQESHEGGMLPDARLDVATEPQKQPFLAHLPACRLSWARDEGWMIGSETLLSSSPDVDTAVVFVHGWNGKAVSTWEEFQGGFRTLAETASADAFFWGYPSMTRKIAFCAAKLMEFLADLVSEPAQSIVNFSLPPGLNPRADSFRYRRIILCAHSMGAVVVRRAVVDLHRVGKLGDPRLHVRLILFAPAHKGSSIPLMLAAGSGLGWLPGYEIVAGLLRLLYYRSLDELARGSDTLRRLEDDSRYLRVRLEEKGEVARYLRALVLHAENDRVVEQEPFDDDPPLFPVMGKSHSSICKPDVFYEQPVESLRGILRESL